MEIFPLNIFCKPLKKLKIMNVFTPNFYSLKKVSVFFIALFALTNIAVAQGPLSGGLIGDDQEICPGEVPLTLTSEQPAQGGNASLPIEYLWMFTTDAGAAAGGPGYTAISGSNSASYSPGPVGVSTYFVRCARRGNTGPFSAESNTIDIVVLNSPTASINPSATSGSTGITIDFNAGAAPGSTYSWDFNNDGITDATGQNVSFTFNSADSYTVTLTVDNGSCTSTNMVDIQINDPIIISISDPCSNCDDGNNYTLGAPDQGYYIHDYIQIIGNEGETWTLSNPTNLFDNAGNALPAGTVVPETTPGVYYLNVWFNASTGGWTTNASNGAALLSTGPGASVSCDPCPSSPLPVEIISFEANVLKSDVELKWATASEINNSHFEIERSFDGQRFDMLTKVEGAGTTAQIQTYKFMDDSAIAGTNYYRLKQVDLDGGFEYFNIVTAQITSEQPVVTVLPNPVKDVARIRVEMNSVENVGLIMVDASGKLVKTININNVGGIQEVNMQDVPAGIYFLTVEGTSGVNTKLIKH